MIKCVCVCPSTCQLKANTTLSDVFCINSIINSIFKKWLSRGRHIYVSDLRHSQLSQLLAVNHTAACCQLCVVTCASAACEQKAFILLQLPHPKKVFFTQRGEYQSELLSLQNPTGCLQNGINITEKSSTYNNMQCLVPILYSKRCIDL